MAAAKKPALALVVAGKPDDDAPPSSKDLGSDEYGAVCDELCDCLGVADDKRSDFAEAFKAAVMACCK